MDRRTFTQSLGGAAILGALAVLPDGHNPQEARLPANSWLLWLTPVMDYLRWGQCWRNRSSAVGPASC